jgi:predicted nuclease with RNAse H fold
MLEFKGNCVVGIDLAASSRNPSGWALLKGNAVKTSLIYTDSEILENTVRSQPALIAIDAPLGLPEIGALFRKADREMIRKRI